MKLVGVTYYAENHLSVDDLENLHSMVGCEVYETNEKAIIDNGKLYLLSDGEDWHEDYLIIE